MFSVEDIAGIVRKETETIKNDHVRSLSGRLLSSWLDESGMPENFCKESILPEVAKLRGKTRREANALLRRVKDRIADKAARIAVMEARHRKSAQNMSTEILGAYRLIEQLGRGVVYFGSARTEEGDRYYELAEELGREVYMLLGSTSWSGAGPGQMEASLKGAKEAGGIIGGIKILFEKGSNVMEEGPSPVLQPEHIVNCRYFGPRKIGLVDAGVRMRKDARTAFIFFPGGYGTLDEYGDMLDLKQLNKLGSNEPVPVIVVNYDSLTDDGGYYDYLLRFLSACAKNGAIGDGKMALSSDDLELFHVCKTNREVLDTLADWYEIPEEKREYKKRIV